MIPSAYEFHWDLGHVMFLGIFYTVLAVAAITVALAVRRSRDEIRRRGADGAAWHETFADLPPERRHCRHEYDGTVAHRICDHDFDCITCARHRELEAAAAGGTAERAPIGVNLHPKRLYHRAHTWVEPLQDGTVLVGLDGVAARCLGRPDHVDLPEPGRVLRAGERAVTCGRGHLRARIPSPVAGTVLEQGDVREGWLYLVQPSDPERWQGQPAGGQCGGGLDAAGAGMAAAGPDSGRPGAGPGRRRAARGRPGAGVPCGRLGRDLGRGLARGLSRRQRGMPYFLIFV